MKVYIKSTNEFGEPTYYCTSYFDTKYRGIEDTFTTDDFSEAESWCWDKLMHGSCVIIENNNTGDSVSYNSDYGDMESAEHIDDFMEYNTKTYTDGGISSIDVLATTKIKNSSVMASAWKAPNGKKYGKQKRNSRYEYRFTKRELKDMVSSGIAEDMGGKFDPMSMRYDVIGISWNETNGYTSGALIEDLDTGNLYVLNTGDAALI